MSPTTRNSLILRLRDRTDAVAWREFVAIYEPVIAKVARQRGMQHADTLELVQRVLMAVARAIHRFEPDGGRARFRTWLFTITHREFCREYAALRKVAVVGRDAPMGLEHVPAAENDEFCIEYRRAVFRWAARRVQAQVKPSTWQAFWLTSVVGESAEATATQIGISVGAVYIARSRVMNRLRAEASSYEEES